MEIELPDGTILDAPDDADPSVVAKAYLKNQRTEAFKRSNPAEYDPSSKEYQAKYGATAGSSGFQNFAAGAGKAIVDTGRGLKQLAIEGSDFFTGSDRGDAYRQEIDEVKRRDAALLGSRGGLLGNIAGNIGVALAPGAALSRAGATASLGRTLLNPQTIRAGATKGAALGALQPVGTEDSRAVNTLIGGSLGGSATGVSNAIGRVAQPVKKALSPVDERAVKTLKDAGVSLDAAQLSGSERLRQAKRFLTDNPLTAQGQVEQAEKTASSFTRAALKTIGEGADSADEQVLGRAVNRIGSVFDDVASKNPVKVDQRLLDKLVEIQGRAAGTLETPQAAVVAKQVDEVIAKATKGDLIDGKAYQNIKSNLDLIGNSPQPGLKFFSGQLRSALDDALERSASPADVARLRTARTQYRNYLAIEKAVDASGNISPARVFNAQNVKAYGGRRALATGRNQTDLMKLAKAGKRIIPERMPNSGTTPRGLLQLALPGAAGAAGGYAQQGDLSGAAGGLALGVAAPYALQRLINSPGGARYLTEGVRPGLLRGALQVPKSLPGGIGRQALLPAFFASQNAQQ